MRARRCSWPASRRGARPIPSRANARIGWSPPSSMCCCVPSTMADRHCATTCSPAVSWDIFRRASMYMTARVRSVQRPAAARPCAGWCNRAARRFIARAASASALTLEGHLASYENIQTETKGRVGIIRLNRPKALNALCAELVRELGLALDAFEADSKVGCMVLTGSERAFAAGADIKEMKDKTYQDVFLEDFITVGWQKVSEVRKPIIAAVAGFALGGGCEMAMMCDFIIAADNARFGQPEIKLGTIPGAGGTQRLPRFVGKSKAMDMVLTGRMMDAAEAERCGLVSRVVPLAKLMDEAIATAESIASLSLPVTMVAKEAVNRAFETTLSEGVRFERRTFHATFAFDDRKEGMAAFAEKRQAAWKHR